MQYKPKNGKLVAHLLASLPMRIPRKITPDGLTDAVVLIGYETVGGSQQDLEKQFEQVSLAHGFQHLVFKEQEAVETTTYVDEAGLIIGIRPGQIGFNGVPATGEPLVKAGSYIGWTSYKQLLDGILSPLMNDRFLGKWNNIAVRYVNILPWVPIAEQLHTAPVFPTPEGFDIAPTFEYRLNWPVTEDGFRVRLRLTDQARRPDETDERGTLFDVEVFLERSGTDFTTLREALELAHKKQKEVFFGLLSPSYLASLQPEYDTPS